MTGFTTRFAPSPTGFLHLGHAASACFAADCATGGRFLLRIEDIDQTRCRAEFVSALEEDLAWLGLVWQGPVRRQSRHLADYRRALDRLAAQDLLYPCFCTRTTIAREVVAMDGAPQGPDGPLYPGICRALAPGEREERIGQGEGYALRLKMDEAARRAGPLMWHDRAAGRQQARPEKFGDVVLARKDSPTSYHLAVTVDDALQGVTLVTRAIDLFPASHIHRLLQALLDLPVPEWHHHPLVTDQAGRRLAKRDGAPSIRCLREQGLTPAEVIGLARFSPPADGRFAPI
jgi:glutamyl-Q tRNA(Asp) synthetase